MFGVKNASSGIKSIGVCGPNTARVLYTSNSVSGGTITVSKVSSEATNYLNVSGTVLSWVAFGT